MALASMQDIFSTLFTAPTEAVVKAEANYRKIAINWLTNVTKLIDIRFGKLAAGKTRSDKDKAAILKLIESQLEMAPVFKLNAVVEAAVTMRVASISRREGKVDLSLGLGTVSLGGGFGFMEQSSSESVLKASARYSISNAQEISLSNYLDNFGLPVTDESEVANAVKELGKLETTLATPTA